MIGFNRFRNKLKGVNNNSPIKREPILPSSSPTLTNQQYTTLTRKSMLLSKKIVIFGIRGDFLSNLLVTVLAQYECSVTLVFLTQSNSKQDNNIINNNSNSSNNNNNNNITTLEILQEDSEKIDEIVKENDVIIACFEWCEFRTIYDQVKVISSSCKNINGNNTNDNENSSSNNESLNENKSSKNKILIDKQIMVVFPIGVEDMEYSLENTSIESIFDPLPVTFIFYSALMQWLFVGPPSNSQPHLQLVLSKTTEGCYWLDCDDLIKAIVELIIQIDLSGATKMYVLTGKECLTCGEISNILYNECSIIVDDYVEDITFLKSSNSLSSGVNTSNAAPPSSSSSSNGANVITTIAAVSTSIASDNTSNLAVNDKDINNKNNNDNNNNNNNNNIDQITAGKILQKKFFTYLQSPISTVGSPSTEEIIKQQPNSFTSFISKCKESQLFTIKPSRSNSLSGNGVISNNNNNNKLNKSLPINLSASTPIPMTSPSSPIMSSSTPTLPSLSASQNIPTINGNDNNNCIAPSKQLTTPTPASTPPPLSPTSTSIPSSTTVPPISNSTTTTSTSSSSSSYRFVFNPFNIIKYSKDFIEETLYKSPTPSVNQPKKSVQELETQQYISLLTSGFKKSFETEINSSISITSTNETPQSTLSNSQSLPSSPSKRAVVPHIEFTNEDYLFESTIDIQIELVDEEQNQIQEQQQQQQQQQQSKTVTSSTETAISTETITTTEVASSTTSTTITTQTQTPINSDNNWTFTSFSPKVFKEIRKYYGVDEEFLKSQENSSGIVKFLEVQTIGRSGSFFYKSEDNKYFIKTIPSNEYDTFVKIFPSYYNHTISYPNTLLPRFFGMYRLKGKLKFGNNSNVSYYTSTHRDIIFVVMANLFYNKQKLEIREKYDLKGSTIGRYVDVNLIQQQFQQQQQQQLQQLQQQQENENITLSPHSTTATVSTITTSQQPATATTATFDIHDLTFKDLNLKRKIHLGALRKAFITQLKIDSEWMNGHGICDYSLLVGLHISDKKSIQQLKTNNLKGNGGKKEDISFFKKDCNGVAASECGNTRIIHPLSTINGNRGRSLSCSSTSDNDTSPTRTNNLNSVGDNGGGNNSPTLNNNDGIQSKQSLSTSNTNNSLSTTPNTIDEDEEGIIYFLGLIDILTTYNLKKRGENAVKGLLFDRTQISAINPKDYQIRFIKYIESIFD
ncbi:hypothetical protein ACTFIU_007551 [Dictyostelium citrinum]